MPLMAYFDKIEDMEENFPSNSEGLNGKNLKIQTMVMASLAVGINEITKDNVEEFWFRHHIWSKLMGDFFFEFDQHGSWVPVTVDSVDITNAIGLKTNAENLSFNSFMKKVRAYFVTKES